MLCHGSGNSHLWLLKCVANLARLAFQVVFAGPAGWIVTLVVASFAAVAPVGSAVGLIVGAAMRYSHLGFLSGIDENSCIGKMRTVSESEGCEDGNRFGNLIPGSGTR